MAWPCGFVIVVLISLIWQTCNNVEKLLHLILHHYIACNMMDKDNVLINYFQIRMRGIQKGEQFLRYLFSFICLSISGWSCVIINFSLSAQIPVSRTRFLKELSIATLRNYAVLTLYLLPVVKSAYRYVYSGCPQLDRHDWSQSEENK